MHLSMYSRDGDDPRVGIADPAGGVVDLAAALTAVDGAEAWEPRDVLDVIHAWPQRGAEVLAAMARLADGGGPAPVEGAAVTVPFPAPRRDAFAIGGNYRKHVEAASRTTGLALTERRGAVFFMKPTGSFTGPTDPIEFDPTFATKVDYEVELGVVLGRGGRDIPVEQALDHVFGYMVVNDVSARDIMLRNKPQIDHFRGKGLDTFFPMGPGVTPRELAGDPADMRLQLWVNGELRQDERTSEMVRGVPEIIAELSKGMSLLAGDIIATGTPSGVAQERDDPEFLEDGDLVEAEIGTLGRLANRVRTR